MGKVSQTIDNLFDGVSRLPVIHRLAGQAEEQLNVLSKFGLSRRPPMEHIKKLITSTTGYADAFVHEIRMSDNEQYVMVVKNGEVRVFDAFTGAEASVTYQESDSYLDTASRGHRAITIGDQTFLVNRAKTIRKGTTVSASWVNEALLYVRSGDFNTTYKVTLEGLSFTYTSHATDRSQIATDIILAGIKALLVANASINGAFTFTTVGSALHIKRNNGDTFTLSASDGLADTAMVAITKSVQRFTDLPARAVEGFTVEITGDDQTQFDNYFVRYTEVDTPDGSGVWKETVEPSTSIGLSAATMPHVLEYAAPLEKFTAFASATRPTLDWTIVGGLLSLRVIFTGLEVLPPGYTASLAGASMPSGATVRYTYTNTTGANVTAATVLAALKTLADASGVVTTTVTGANNYLFQGSNTNWNGFWFESDIQSGTVYSPELSMVADAYIGYTLNNLTDGSTGVITDNTAQVVVCGGGFSGGAYNIVQDGDICTITGPGVYFVFRQGEWGTRAVGDVESSPFPSIVDHKIEDVFESQGRLWFTAGPNVIASRAGDLFNFFRQTATQLLPDDPIDVKSALRGSPAFHSACNWNGAILLFSDYAQFLLEGQPVFSPTTVSLRQVSAYQSLVNVHPVVLGDSVFFVSEKAGVPIVQELRVFGQAQTVTAREVTTHIPNYFEGEPLELLGDDAKGVLFLRTDERDRLYVYVYQNSGDEKLQSSWSTWTLPGETIGATLALGELQPVVKHSDGIYLNTIVLDAELDRPHLDRLCTTGIDGVTVDVSVPGFVTWTLPFSNVDVSVVHPVTFETISTVTVGGSQLKHTIAGGDATNYATLGAYLGVPYSSSFEMSRLFVRDQNGKARPRGRVRIGRLRIRYFDSSDLSVRVAVVGKADRVTVLNELDLEAGVLHVPVQAHNEALTLTLFTDTPGPFNVSAVDWEGESFPTGFGPA